MDAYEATRVVMGRIQAVDPENAAKILGLLLLQDHGEKEMIRLAFGPESLLLSVVQKAHKELGLATPPAPSTPSAAAASPFLLSRQNSSSRLLGNSPPSWAPLPENPDELLSPSNTSVPSPFYGGGGDLIDELQLQDQLAFLNDGHGPHLDRRSLSGAAEGASPFSCNLMGWTNGFHRRSCSAAELAEAAAYGWRPCLYFARGYCKNGTSCRFLHGLPDDPAAASPLAGVNMDSVVERQCHEMLLRHKSQRLMASAGAGAVLPYSPTGSIPPFTSSSQKVAAAAAALMLGGDDAAHKFMVRSPRMERSDLAALANPGSRQIYLTFPADSTFREEDVSNYFSIYGPVQDVRIPYQQKRMFGFVTFVYPETVKLILAKGNPHFVCDARVLVKPYKEKGKVPDNHRKQQQQAERVDFSGCTTPTGLVDAREAYDFQQLVSSGAARMMYGGGLSQEVLLRKRLEEQLHAVELQQAIELQNRRFMGLQLLDLKSGRLNSSTISTPTNVVISSNNQSNASQEEAAPLVEVKSQGTAAPAAAAALSQATVDAGADKEESTGETNPNEDTGFQESAEHNLPDSPFASPTKSSFKVVAFSDEADLENTVAAPPHNNGSHLMATSSLLPPTSTLDKASFECCFFQVPRFASGHGAVGM